MIYFENFNYTFFLFPWLQKVTFRPNVSFQKGLTQSPKHDTNVMK